MNIAILVSDFPRLSESFILRLIEGLIKNQTYPDIIVAGIFDQENLKKFSPIINSMHKEGKIRIINNKNHESKWVKLIYVAQTVLSRPLKLIELKKKGNRWKSIFRGALLYRLIKNKNINKNLFHAQFATLSLYYYIANHFMGKNPSSFGSIRGFDISRYNAISDNEIQFLSGKRVKFLCVSESLAKLANKRGVQADRLDICYSAMPLEKMPFAVKNYDATKKKIKLIQVGRLVEKKGYFITLKLIKIIKEKMKDLEFHLEIVGDGPLRAELESKVEDYNLTDKVSFLGAKSNQDTLKLIKTSDIILVPSQISNDGDVEGIPNIAKEAMALGTIVLSSNHSGLPEIVVDSKTGFLFEEKNLDNFLNAFIRAINKRDQWELISREARVKIENLFDSNTLSKKLIEQYKSIYTQRIRENIK